MKEFGIGLQYGDEFGFLLLGRGLRHGWINTAAQQGNNQGLFQFGYFHDDTFFRFRSISWLDYPWFTHGTGAQTVSLGVVDEFGFDGVELDVAFEPHADISGVHGGH